MYEEIQSNKRKSIFLIIGFIFLISIIGFAFGLLIFNYGEIGFIIALIIALIMVVFNYYKGDKLILKISKARKPTKEENAYLINVVEELSIAAGVPVPKIWVIDDSAPNAFATGRDPQHASIAVTSGLLKKLNRLELEGVIAHEMSHIKNYDIRLMMLASVLVGVVVLLSDMMIRSFLWGGRGSSDERKGGVLMIVVALLLAILAPLFAYLLQFALSRRREFLADANAALLTRYPEGLASALEKLSKDKEALEVANRGTEPLYIVTPSNLKGRFGKLFSTHPPIQERIKRLRGM